MVKSGVMLFSCKTRVLKYCHSRGCSMMRIPHMSPLNTGPVEVFTARPYHQFRIQQVLACSSNSRGNEACFSDGWHVHSGLLRLHAKQTTTSCRSLGHQLSAHEGGGVSPNMHVRLGFAVLGRPTSGWQCTCGFLALKFHSPPFRHAQYQPLQHVRRSSRSPPNCAENIRLLSIY